MSTWAQKDLLKVMLFLAWKDDKSFGTCDHYQNI